jgi:hypothetical protein
MKTIPCRWCGMNAGTSHLDECPVGQLEREREEVREALLLILPLAKGYAATHPVGSNQKYVEIAARAAAGAEDKT